MMRRARRRPASLQRWFLSMCGRFNVETSPLSVWLLEILGVGHPGPDNHNAAPTEQIAVVRANAAGARETVPMRWWLTPYWSKEAATRYSMFNARCETILTSAAFREPFRRRRCLVPISGFYEWSAAPAAARDDSVPAAPRSRGASGKLAWYIRPRSEPGLLLAGIWDRWIDRATGDVLESFAIVTTAAHPALRFVHTRQPVMLDLPNARRWLDPASPTDDLVPLLEPMLAVEIDAVPVSSHVNNARNKDSRCVEPIAAPVPVGVTGDAPA
jgi:putative SOS response-associated peptidase YedK